MRECRSGTHTKLGASRSNADNEWTGESEKLRVNFSLKIAVSKTDSQFCENGIGYNLGTCDAKAAEKFKFE